MPGHRHRLQQRGPRRRTWGCRPRTVSSTLLIQLLARLVSFCFRRCHIGHINREMRYTSLCKIKHTLNMYGVNHGSKVMAGAVGADRGRPYFTVPRAFRWVLARSPGTLGTARRQAGRLGAGWASPRAATAPPRANAPAGTGAGAELADGGPRLRNWCCEDKLGPHALTYLSWRFQEEF